MDFSFASVIGLVSVLWGGSPAAVDATPQGLIEAVYAQPGDERSLQPDEVYSDRLQDQLATYFANQQATLVASTDASPPIDLVPFDPLSLLASTGPVTISAPVISGRQATTTVNIETGTGPSQLSLFMVEQDNGWRIDDIASFNADGQPWLLSWILRYDPPMGG